MNDPSTTALDAKDLLRISILHQANVSSDLGTNNRKHENGSGTLTLPNMKSDARVLRSPMHENLIYLLYRHYRGLDEPYLM